MKKLLIALPLLLLGATMSYGQGAIVSVPTTTLNLTVGAESAIIVGTTPGFSTSTAFAAYTTTTPFTYYIRTSGSGSGSISVQFTADWAGGRRPVNHHSAHSRRLPLLCQHRVQSWDGWHSWKRHCSE